MSGISRLVIAIVLVAAAIVGYRWWNSDQRQISRALDDLAEGLSHERPATGLSAVAAAAGVQQYFTTDVVIEAGRSLPSLVGRDAVTSAAARLAVAVPSIRIEFVDRQIAIDDGDRASATISCTASATVQDRAGQESVDARQVVITMRRIDGRWLVARAEAVNVLEPVT